MSGFGWDTAIPYGINSLFLELLMNIDKLIINAFIVL